jgi:hypothetical protein
MNERIRQLWEDNDTIEVCYPEQGSPVSVSATTLEKFAQLIVQECAEVIFETPVKYTEIDIMHIIRDRVREHFGVEP